MMPSSESFAGNQANWGASAADGWGATNTEAGAGETNEWTAAPVVNAASTGSWWLS